MHNNEERFSRRLVPVSILEGGGERERKGKRRSVGERERGRQVFRLLPELTKSLRRMEKLLSEPHAQESSVHENLSINQKIYEFRIRNEELSRADPKLSCAGEFWVSVGLLVCQSICLSAWRLVSCLVGTSGRSLGRDLDAFKLKQTI